jgi:hypothetical protein
MIKEMKKEKSSVLNEIIKAHEKEKKILNRNKDHFSKTEIKLN